MEPAVVVVKVMVTDTLVALTLLERAIDGLPSAALNTGGIKTEATLSNTVAAAVKVEIVQVVEAAAFSVFLSPATVQVTAELAATEAGVVTCRTRTEPDQVAFPADKPVQETANVGATA